jgi:hypothetical protein
MMKLLASFGLCMAAYSIVAILLCRDIIAPFALLTIFPSRLGIPYWEFAAGVSATVAALLALFAVSRRLDLVYAPPLFVVTWMLLTVVSVGAYADWMRKEAIFAFKPDVAIQHSFFRSLREAPRGLQLYLHAAVLKDCVPYAWSYRQMGLYRLQPNTAINVLPREWLVQCAIKQIDPTSL